MLGIANELGWRCSVVGRKKKFSKQIYNLANTVIEYEEAGNLKINDYTAVLLMTHDYNWDKK